jgi:GT2 family glycosyltransferase
MDRGNLTANISIIIPCIKVEKLLLKCIYTCKLMCPESEIIVLLDYTNGISDIKEDVNIIETGPITIAKKRNIGVKASNNKYIGFIDSDAYPQDGWSENAISILNNDSDIWIVGGPNISPIEEPYDQFIVGLALKSLFVTGPNHFYKLIGEKRNCSNLPSCNMILRKEDYLEIGGMDESLYASEDNDLCSRIKLYGKNIVYDPNVIVYHKNRSFLWFIFQRYTFGLEAWSILSKSKNIKDIFVLAPFTFLCFLFTGFLTLFFKEYLYFYSVVIFVYLVIILFEAIKYTNKIIHIPSLFTLIILGNLSPGVGSILKLFGLKYDSKFYRNDM